MSGPIDLSHEAYESFRAAVRICRSDNDSAATEIENFVDGLLAVIERHGGRRCDIPACNCNSYHWPRCEERLEELRAESDAEALRAYTQGKHDGYDVGCAEGEGQ